MDMVITIISYILIPLWVIGMYEIGKNYLNPNITKNWKSLGLFILIVAFYSYMILFKKGPETGYSSEFNLDFFLKIFIPSMIAILTGLYISKKK